MSDPNININLPSDITHFAQIPHANQNIEDHRLQNARKPQRINHGHGKEHHWKGYGHCCHPYIN